MFKRNSLTLVAVLFAAGVGATFPGVSAFAYDVNSTKEVNVDAKGVSLRGYDPVAYFTKGQPTQGKPDITATYNGATYNFASNENRDLFRANPAKYAPQYGGFCAMGVSLDKKLDGDPLVWHVANDKLYVNVNKDVQKRYLEDVAGNNKRADANWPQIKNKAPKAVNN